MAVTYPSPNCLQQQSECVAAVLLVLTGLSGDRPLTREAEGELHTLPAQFPALLPAGEWGKPGFKGAADSQ